MPRHWDGILSDPADFDRPRKRTPSYREVEATRVIGQVVGDLVLIREGIVAARERDPGQRVEIAGREETQRIPASAPCVADARVSIDEQHLAPRARQLVGDGESTVARAHDEHVGVGELSRGYCSSWGSMSQSRCSHTTREYRKMKGTSTR